MALSIFLLIYLLFETRLSITIAIVGIIVVLQAFSLIKYVETISRDLARFLLSIRHSDFSMSSRGGLRGKPFRELNEAFGEVTSEFIKANSEKEEQYRYIRALVEHIGAGIISFDSDGKIDLINKAAKKLLKIGHINNIYGFESSSKPLVDALLSKRTGEKALVRIEIEGELMTLAVVTTGLKLRNRHLTLASIQNIESELAEGEMEGWQKLIRVLTHEIMNSVTPIASLSNTARKLIIDQNGESENFKIHIDEENKNDLADAIITIEKRCQGLLNFVNTYRRLSRIPEPNLSIFPIGELLNRIEQLMNERIRVDEINLSTSVNPKSLKLTADIDLIEQVIINLILNSINAVKENENPEIELKSWLDEKGHVNISVSDNGSGIKDDIKEKIFTPFFTTQKDGSGIGLSLSRQIMRKHGGAVSIKSKPNIKTIFTLRF